MDEVAAMERPWHQRTVISEVLRALRQAPEGPALAWPARRGREAVEVSRAGLVDGAARLAAGLNGLGLQEGARVLVWSENHPWWIALDLALLALGCPSVPRGTEAPAKEIEFIVRRTKARGAFVETTRQLDSLAAGTSLEWVVVFRGPAPDATACGLPVWTLDQLLAQGPADAPVDWFHQEAARRSPDEVASIVFTSGTTGQPKGVVLHQSHLAANLCQLLSVVGFLREGRTFLSILPPWHMFERMVEYALLCRGLIITYSDRRHFSQDLRQVRPHVLGAVPRVWILLRDAVLARVQERRGAGRLLLRAALGSGRARTRVRRRARAKEQPTAPPLAGRDRLLVLLAPLLAPLRRRVIVALGLDRLAAEGVAISGGGSLPDHVDEFLESLGVTMLNGYGLTETSPVLALRLPAHNIPGTVGPPVPRTEISLRDVETGAVLPEGSTGVIHARGPQVMAGYYQDPDATAQVLDAEGWFNTGDLGRLTAEGHLAITGRAKDTIVLLSGENVDPEPLENALTESPLIHQAVVVGQDQKFLSALIVPEAESRPLPPIPSQEIWNALRREIDDRVNGARGFRPHERIVRFAVLKRPFSVEDGSLSQTMKLKRDLVQQRHDRQIHELYERESARPHPGS